MCLVDGGALVVLKLWVWRSDLWVCGVLLQGVIGAASARGQWTRNRLTLFGGATIQGFSSTFLCSLSWSKWSHLLVVRYSLISPHWIFKGSRQRMLWWRFLSHWMLSKVAWSGSFMFCLSSWSGHVFPKVLAVVLQATAAVLCLIARFFSNRSIPVL